MRPWAHFLASSILALLSYPTFNWKAIFIIAGGVLIDIDHYLWYIYQYRKLNFFNAYKYFSKNMDTGDFSNAIGILLLFHTIEFLLVMIISSFYFESALLFTMGLLLHYLLDLIYLFRIARHLVVNHSLIHWIYKNHIQKV